MSDYVRYALASAGLTYTEQDIDAIYATGHPVAVTDTLLHYADPPIGPICTEMLATMKKCVEEARKGYARWPVYECEHSGNKIGRFTDGTKNS